MKQQEVKLFFRKKLPTAHSIETIFNAIHELLKKENEGKSYNIEKIELPHVSGIKTIIPNLFFAKKQNNDINHITGDVHYIALAFKKANTILTVHDCVTLQRKNSWLKQLVFKYLWFVWPVHQSSWVTVISQKTKKELLQYVKVEPNKIIVIPDCYHPNFQYTPYVFNIDCPTILQLGTKTNKNLEKLIPALKGIHCKLDIIGIPSDTQKKLLKENNINYTTSYNLTTEEIVQKYKSCDLLSFVSTYEGFGMPIIEANAVGRPIVTSRISPLTEVGDKAVCYVDPSSIESIRDGILKIIENKEYRNHLIQIGKENAQKYTVERVSLMYEQLYEKMIKEKH
jgi:glycosyltransferase involved in cell wall biosynthesis